MNVTTITMDPEQAKAKLKAYRANRHRDAEQVYGQCADAYAALASGTPLIDAEEAIRSSGFDEKMRPKIAIARADMKEVRFRWDGGDNFALFDTRPTWNHSQESFTRRINMQRTHDLFDVYFNKNTKANERYNKTVEAYAMIPMVPADVRPKVGQLKDWFVLWEVEHWSEKSRTARPPRDPFLLKHVGGTLYAILAEWDLTDLEMAIMKQQGIRR